MAIRICSLLPSATEIVAELGLADCLVGVSAECDWPPQVRALPVVTSSRIDSAALSAREIDEGVREALRTGDSLYALDEAADRCARPRARDHPGPVPGVRSLERSSSAGSERSGPM